MQSGKIIDYSGVFKCDKLSVKFYFIAVYNSAVMEYWTTPLEQRIKLALKSRNAKQSPRLIIPPSPNQPRSFLAFATDFQIFIASDL